LEQYLSKVEEATERFLIKNFGTRLGGCLARYGKGKIGTRTKKAPR
jgi:hypothetical protein